LLRRVAAGAAAAAAAFAGRLAAVFFFTISRVRLIPGAEGCKVGGFFLRCDRQWPPSLSQSLGVVGRLNYLSEYSLRML
jgi:hypothetical protein